MGGDTKPISLYVGTKTFSEVWEMVRRDCPDALPYLDMLMHEVEQARAAAVKMTVSVTGYNLNPEHFTFSLDGGEVPKRWQP